MSYAGQWQHMCHLPPPPFLPTAAPSSCSVGRPSSVCRCAAQASRSYDAVDSKRRAVLLAIATVPVAEVLWSATRVACASGTDVRFAVCLNVMCFLIPPPPAC